MFFVAHLGIRYLWPISPVYLLEELGRLGIIVKTLPHDVLHQ